MIKKYFKLFFLCLIICSNIVEFRKKYADQFLKRHNLKLGFMSAFVKASACALLDNPIANAGKNSIELII
jgi:2-oxoglutarate dehydrogenase E2 component (dihydrolipoamide succinyltransferase)